MNRILSSMPYYKLTRQIEYKAAWEGVTVINLSERGTSKTCHRCGSMNTSRVVQSVFQCHDCGLVYNADLNGAVNIAKRVWEQRFHAGAAGSPLITLPERNLSVDDEERSSRFAQNEEKTEPTLLSYFYRLDNKPHNIGI
jgi:transposase